MQKRSSAIWRPQRPLRAAPEPCWPVGRWARVTLGQIIHQVAWRQHSRLPRARFGRPRMWTA